MIYKNDDIEMKTAGKPIQVVMVRMRDKDGSFEVGNVEWLFTESNTMKIEILRFKSLGTSGK